MTAEETALALLRWLVSTQGASVVASILGIVLGTGPGMLIEPTSLLIADLLRALFPVLGQDRVTAEVQAAFDAADVAADVAEKAKFG